MSLSVVAVSGSLHAPSKTSALLDAIIAQLGEAIEIDVVRVDVHLLTLGLSRKSLGPEAEAALKTIESADVLVVASPIYRASYTGLFKHLFDLVGQDALAGTPVLLAGTGGNQLHSLAIEHQLRPLFAFFRAVSLPVGVYAVDSDFAEGAVASEALAERIRGAVNAALPIVRAVSTRQ